MANIKTFIDQNRLPVNLDRYDVEEVMPGHYDELYPNLSRFLELYYQSLEQDGNPAKLVNDLLTNRDVLSVQQEFLGYLSNELLLGKPYFEQFKDKRTALQFSNLLYRSKGTEYSIQQFFRIFYTLDVEVFYGRDYLFNVGDPLIETLEYPTQGELTGSTFRYTFQGLDVEVYVKTEDDQWVTMRQDIDYIQNFADRRIEFQPRLLDQFNVPRDGLGYAEGVDSNILIHLAETGMVGFTRSPVETRVRLVTRKNDVTVIGTSTEKKITDAKFHQLFALMIQTPVSSDVWKEAYKTFVHPAGMFLAGRVQIVSVAEVGIGDYGLSDGSLISIFEPEETPTAKVFKGVGVPTLNTDITEMGNGPFGYQQRSRVNDFLRETYYTQNSDALQIGTLDSIDATGWGRQYYQMYRANDINARTLDDTFITLSNTINTLDENVYLGDTLNPNGDNWLPENNGGIRPPKPVRVLTTEDGTFLQTEDGSLIKL